MGMGMGMGTETGVAAALARSLEARVMRCRWVLVMNKEEVLLLRTILRHSLSLVTLNLTGSNPIVDITWGKGDSGGPRKVVSSTRTRFGFSFVLHRSC
jgi:hypothetical protein